MKILYLLYSFTTGGTERLVSQIAGQMLRQGHDVHLYIVNDLYDKQMLEQLDPGIRVYLQKRPTGGGQKLQTLWSVAQYLRKHRIKVVHCNSLDAPELLMLQPFLAPGVKVLYTVHGMHQITGKGRLQILYRNLLCHRVIGISQCVSQDIQKAGIHPKKIVTVPNAIDFSHFPHPCSKAFDPEHPIIGNVARIQPAVKGQDVLIRAMQLLRPKYPHIQCLFAGAPAPGQEAQLEQLQTLTRQLALEDTVRFVGGIRDVPGFLSQLDVFALPSRSEGFGISLVEAMAMELPCIASDLEGPAEVLRQGAYGVLFPADDPAALAQQLDALLQNYDAHKQTAVSANAYVRSHYDIVNLCKQLEALCR